jgi:chorismate synthase
MLALVLMDHALRHRAQNADVRCATPRIAATAPTAAASAGSPNQATDPDPDEA